MSEISAVPGLTTPQLNGGEVAHDSKINNNTDSKSDTEQSKPSVFDIAADLENKLQDVIGMIDEHDKDVNNRIDKLVSRVTKLENSLKES